MAYEEIFELKQENRRREIEALQEQLRELREALAQRERFRDEIIDRRLDELTNESRDRRD